MTATFESMSAEVLRAVWSAGDALAYDDLHQAIDDVLTTEPAAA